MNWQLLPQFALSGLLSGGPIALVALGIVLIFKSSRVFNFAHGHMLLIGSMTAWWFAVEAGWSLWLAIPAALLVSALLGLAVERLALRPLTGQPLLTIILMTLALSQVLQGMSIVVFGTAQRNFPAIFSVRDPYRLTLPVRYEGELITVVLQQHLVWSFLAAMVGVALLWAFFQYTNVGLAMRATAEDHETAQSVGIRINRVFALSWALAGMLATVGGVLIATASGLDMSLSVVALAAFPAVLLGGLESIPGAVIGALLIGLAQGLVSLPNNDFFLGAETARLIRNSAEIVPYLILLVVLTVRPEGLFGEERIERV
jgi:branched-chain amino acid transport system permease protein